MVYLLLVSVLYFIYKFFELTNKNFHILNIFSEDECKQIINGVEKNKNKLRTGEENGDLYLSAYEMQIEDIGYELSNLILNKTKNIVDYRFLMTQKMIVKYSEELICDMPGHYDGSDYTLVINLNNDFTGGGTKMHFYNFIHKPQDYPSGSALLFDSSGLLTWHKAMPVCGGVRYVIVLKWNKTPDFLNSNYKKYKWVIEHFVFNNIKLLIGNYLRKIKWLK